MKTEASKLFGCRFELDIHSRYNEPDMTSSRAVLCYKAAGYHNHDTTISAAIFSFGWVASIPLIFLDLIN
jgi:hypothetical protein